MKNKYFLSRRSLVTQGVAAVALLPLAQALGAQSSGPGTQAALAAATDSELIYITALSEEGSTGRCQAEVWFVAADHEFWVVTAGDSWRARNAAENARVKIWVGDVGQWQAADGAYQSLPALIARSTLENAADIQQRALALFGAKYPASWTRWGPRFKNGLADGSRVLIRYQPQA
ncbi:MAG: hypothetical protein ACR2PZ_00175 [Pseudomonadales bacterium]